MAAALEERCSREVICRDEVIGALKKENVTLEAEKARLSEEVNELSSVRREIDSLRKERDAYKTGSEVLKKEKEDAEASAAVLRTSVAEAEVARDLAMQRVEKAEDIAERLRKELDAERLSAAELQTRMQKAEAEAAAIVELYADSLAKFGGSTSAPPPSGDVGACLAWMKSHIRMLPDFVGGGLLILGLWPRLVPSLDFCGAEVAPTPRGLTRWSLPRRRTLARAPPACANLSGTLSVRSGLGLGGLRRRRWRRLVALRYS
jgi:hypothetical protein